MLRDALFGLILMLVVVTPAAGAPAGSLTGIVLDQTGAGVPGAVITVEDAGHQMTTVVSGGDGRYTVNALVPGRYVVRVTLSGFVQPKPVQVRIARARVTLDLHLVLAAQETTVTVVGHAAALSTDPTENATATRIEGHGLEALSDDPDDLVTDLQGPRRAGGRTGRRPTAD